MPMKRMTLKGLMVAAMAAGAGQAAMAAEAYDDTGAVYLAPMAQYTLLNHKRVSNDEFGYQIGLGYNFAPNFAAEIAYSPGSFPIKSGPYQGASEKLDAASLDVLYKFLPMTSTFRPYLLGGTGLMSDDIGRESITHQAWLVEGGAGMLLGLGDQTGSTRLQLRAEAKYRQEFIQNVPYVPKNPGDVLISAGFQVMFGA